MAGVLLGVSHLAERMYGQELFCEVRIDYSRVSQADPSTFRALQKTIEEFLNNRAWTQIRFEEHERIRCQIFIQVQDVSGEVIRASAIIQAERPVYNSSYTTPIFVYRDDYWSFSYTRGEQIIYLEGTYTSELAALLSFYAYLILGLDFSTFGLQGGLPFLNKALEIATLASSLSQSEGWSPTDKKRMNRYWLVTWLLQPGTGEKILTALYRYHREGLDIMYEAVAEGRKKVLEALRMLNQVYKEDSRNMAVKVIIEAKRQELVGIFSGAPPHEKQQAFSVLTSLDPSHRNEYSKIFR